MNLPAAHIERIKDLGYTDSEAISLIFRDLSARQTAPDAGRILLKEQLARIKLDQPERLIPRADLLFRRLVQVRMPWRSAVASVAKQKRAHRERGLTETPGRWGAFQVIRELVEPREAVSA